MKIPRKDRNKLTSYFDDLQRAIPSDEEFNGTRVNLKRVERAYVASGGGKQYDKQNISILQATERRLTKSEKTPVTRLIKRRRYDDLWEDFIEYGLVEKEIRSADDLRSAVEDAVGRNRFWEEAISKSSGEKRNRVLRNFRNAVTGLSRGFLGTRRVQEIIVENNVEKLKPTRATLFEKDVLAKRRERFKQLVRDGRAYRVYRPTTKKYALVYQDKGGRYRDFNTSKFTASPEAALRGVQDNL